MMNTDVVIVGAGPAGIFTALEMLKKGSRQKIIMVEKGSAIENRRCPKNQTHKCVGCKPCHITTGFSGAGAFSDGKLSLSYEVGGDLPTLIVQNRDQPGHVRDVSDILARSGVNIATLHLYRDYPGGNAVMIIETDKAVHQESLEALRAIRGITGVTFVSTEKEA